MLEVLIIIRLSILAATCIVAAIYWPYYKNSTQRYFFHFLLYVLLTEIAGAFLGPLLESNQHFIFNTYTIISFSFYMNWFYKIIKMKKFMFLCFIIFIVSVLISVYFNGFNTKLLPVPITVGTIIIILNSMFFLKTYLTDNEVVNFKNSQKFWIVSSLLTFYIGFLPLQLLMFYLDTYSLNYNVILTLLFLALYGGFTISFLCLKKK
ncbi:hypothetical protein [Siansivirga zeaxanthinifaciens]|uniref:Uncharacterized protein n=1 Tax=Siansivirga zeaxanthinifaciens CC-SAMT-1 TaxID=1454006 RepID=A0A0C5W0H3_9FLAO|nr:hypothetical protein [Siansivirga zeaxanthinifaciens]AJR04751.1 hypothetical protein AW14_03100 [Siansivirga zeaxanthinifaciens CC-SAMT-1]